MTILYEMSHIPLTEGAVSDTKSVKSNELNM